MKATYRVLAYLIPVIVALQASFIALGVFGLGKYVEDGNDFTKACWRTARSTGDVGFAMHSFGAMADRARRRCCCSSSRSSPRSTGGVRAALFVFLDVVFQWVLAFVSFGVWAVGVLHGLNAFLLFGLGLMAAATATRSIKGASAPVSAATASTA